jgi:hypothetical protein
MKPGVDGHDGRLMILVNQHGKTIGKGELLVRNVNVGRRQTAGE